MRGIKQVKTKKLVAVGFAVSATLVLASCEKKEVVTRIDNTNQQTELAQKTPVNEVKNDKDSRLNYLEKAQEATDKISNKISNEITNREPLKFSDKDKTVSSNKNQIITELENPYVVDGDTIHAKDKTGSQIKIRMLAVDAPEGSQEMGYESTLSLTNCVKGKGDVILISDKNNLKDKYGRYLGTVVAGNTNCNLYQVETGMAWFYEYFSNNIPKDEADTLRSAQETARATRIGIWKTNPTPPWEFRKSKK